MSSTMTIEAADIDALAGRLAALDDVLDETEKVTLLAVFALAGEALDARVDDQLEVTGFAANAFDVSLGVEVPPTLPGLGDGLQGSLLTSRKAGKGQQEYLRVTMKEVFITS